MANNGKGQYTAYNSFTTIAVRWCGRDSRAYYTKQDLIDIFTAFGPIKNVHFHSPRFVEIEFVWIGSACLALRASKIQLPGKVPLRRQWARISSERQYWMANKSRARQDM